MKVLHTYLVDSDSEILGSFIYTRHILKARLQLRPHFFLTTPSVEFLTLENFRNEEQAHGSLRTIKEEALKLADMKTCSPIYSAREKSNLG